MRKRKLLTNTRNKGCSTSDLTRRFFYSPFFEKTMKTVFAGNDNSVGYLR